MCRGKIHNCGRKSIQDKFSNLTTAQARYRARNPKRTSEWRLKNPLKAQAHKTSQREQRLKLRMACLEKLGLVCKKCGFSDTRVLQIDHVNGGGNTERRELCERAFLEKVLADTFGEYQLLCANCNWLKEYE